RLAGAGGQRVERGQGLQRDERRSSAEMLARADEPLLGQLVLPAPDTCEVGREVDETSGLVPNRPVHVLAARERLPERGQHQVVVWVEDGKPDAVDPCGRTADRREPTLS